MNKQQVLSHCKIVLTHKYKSSVDGSTIIKIVDTFYKEDDPQQSISKTLEHYQLMLEGLWSLPIEATVEVKQQSMIRDWSRTW